MNTFTESASSNVFPRLLFGHHRGYVLREQWLTQGLLTLAQTADPEAQSRLFTFPDARDLFGIGPDMIGALRYWLQATGLMVEHKGRGEERKIPVLTPLGTMLAQHDPYLKREGSLWLLHAHLARNLLQAPSFYWFFQCFVGTTSFTKEACVDALLSWSIKEGPHQHINPDVLRKDVDCLFRLYTSGPRSQQTTPEKSLLASPFRRLHLLQCLPGKADVGSTSRRDIPQYLLCPPQAGDIPELIVLALLLEDNQGTKQMPLTHVLYRHQQIGRNCGVKMDMLVDAFQHLSTRESSWVPRPILINDQKWLELPAVTIEQVLLRYYAQPS
jgi:hypothetical protein